MLEQTLNDRYEIQRKLSQRQGKQTFLAFDNHTETQVIVKLILFGQGIDWQDLKLFEREAETLQRLDHPAIPNYLDYFDVDLPDFKGFALVQTYIQAISLEEHINNGRRFSEDDIKQIAKDLLEILIYLHSKTPPLIHRDIKPSNILLRDRSGNSSGKVYLIDFGSVQNAATKKSGTMTVVGTYGYMPLEQFGGRAVPASDLYSLGGTLIYLITGNHPADLPQIDGKIDIDNLTNDISLPLKKWLKQMIEPNLSQRLESAELALQTLEKLAESEEIAIIEKPRGRKIQISKDYQEIKIFIPPLGFNAGRVFMVFFAIVWNSFMFFWTLGTFFVSFPMNVPFILFSLPFWYQGASLAYTALFPIFGKTYLTINEKTIDLSQELFGFRHQIIKPSPRDYIDRLVFIPKYFTQEWDGRRVKVPAKLVIYAGKNQYKLEVGVGGFIETETELQWLADELSQWLGIPIIRE